ncbi:MAG: hypothetical protein RR051_04035 [Clostridiales bacterium]
MNKIARKIYMLLLLLLCGVLAGCQDKQEMADMATVLGVGLDGGDSGYLLTVELANPLAADDLGEGKIFVADGDTIAAAVESLSLQLDKDLFWGHLQLISVGEDVLDRLYAISKYFYSDKRIAASPVVILAAKEAGELLRADFGESAYCSFGLAEALNLQAQKLSIPQPGLRPILESKLMSRRIAMPVAGIKAQQGNPDHKQAVLLGWRHYDWKTRYGNE